jgi:hypothetical protein
MAPLIYNLSISPSLLIEQVIFSSTSITMFSNKGFEAIALLSSSADEGKI